MTDTKLERLILDAVRDILVDKKNKVRLKQTLRMLRLFNMTVHFGVPK